MVMVRQISSTLVYLCTIGQVNCMKTTTLYKMYFAVLSLVFFAASPVLAASYFVVGPKDIVVGKPFEVTFYAESQKDPINALHGSAVYPSDIFELKSISDGDSIVSLWVRPPQSINQRIIGTTNYLPFDGLMPGGTTFNRGKLFTLTLVARNTAAAKQGTIGIQNGEAFLSDGKGTKITMTSRSFILPKILAESTSNKPETAVLGERINDTNPPQSLMVSVAKSNTLFNGEWFLAFNAVDAESGIDHYEVQERQDKTPLPRAWVSSTNPYRLIDQKRSSYVFVKAIDRAGNEKIEIIEPLSSHSGYTQLLFWCIIILLCISAVFVWIRNKRTNHVIQ